MANIFNNFDDYDKLFFELLYKYKDDFEKTQKSSTKYKLELTKEIVNLESAKIKAINKNTNKTTEHTIINFGLYNNENEIFQWHGGFNEMMKEHILKYGNLFENINTVDKLMDNIFIKIPKEYCNVIPYLLSIINPAFNLVRFETEDCKVNCYNLITLNLKNYFNFDSFVEDIENYKKINIFRCV